MTPLEIRKKRITVQLPWRPNAFQLTWREHEVPPPLLDRFPVFWDGVVCKVRFSKEHSNKKVLMMLLVVSAHTTHVEFRIEILRRGSAGFMDAVSHCIENLASNADALCLESVLGGQNTPFNTNPVLI